jgi:tetratricopeptide (TPR) repeat protein
MSNEAPVQPSLASLMSKYLEQQRDAQAAGLASCDPSSEVVLYDAGPVQPIDARIAWLEATAVIPLFGQKLDKSCSVPPHWPQLVAAHEPVAALAFCVGNFPQLLRNLQVLLHKTDLAKLLPSASQPTAAPALLDWSEQASLKPQFPQLLLAVGALRLAKQFERCEALLTKHEGSVPKEWRAAWSNEKAALLWHRGRTDEACKLWESLPDSVPVLFNRGMAALFSGRIDEARAALTQAVSQLPETGAWHHLGRLYLTLAHSAP